MKLKGFFLSKNKTFLKNVSSSSLLRPIAIKRSQQYVQYSFLDQLFQAIFASFSGSLFAWSCGSFRKKIWYILGSSSTRVPPNTAISGQRENGEVEEDFTASGMAMAMAELDLERSEKVDQESCIVHAAVNV